MRLQVKLMFEDKEKDRMTKEQEAQVESAIEYCDAHDKSTEFMLQFAADTAGVDMDEVVEYLAQKAEAKT